MYELTAPQQLAIQLGRPMAAWWETYYVIPDQEGPDPFLIAEVKAFIELLRGHSNTTFGASLRADHLAILLSSAGMLARDMRDLHSALYQIQDWYDLYSPKPVRLGIAQEIKTNGPVPRLNFKPRPIGARRHKPRKGVLARLRDRVAPKPYQWPRPGERSIRIGTSRLMIGVGEEAEMYLGVVVDGDVWVISEIDDRRDRDPRPAPAPTPELVA